MDYRIFNLRTYINAWDCTWGCMDTVRESALKDDLGRKILASLKIEPVLAASQSDTLPTELHPHPCRHASHRNTQPYALTRPLHTPHKSILTLHNIHKQRASCRHVTCDAEPDCWMPCTPWGTGHTWRDARLCAFYDEQSVLIGWESVCRSPDRCWPLTCLSHEPLFCVWLKKCLHWTLLYSPTLCRKTALPLACQEKVIIITKIIMCNQSKYYN